jgi:hypothetical protein
MAGTSTPYDQVLMVSTGQVVAQPTIAASERQPPALKDL